MFLAETSHSSLSPPQSASHLDAPRKEFGWDESFLFLLSCDIYRKCQFHKCFPSKVFKFLCLFHDHRPLYYVLTLNSTSPYIPTKSMSEERRTLLTCSCCDALSMTPLAVQISPLDPLLTCRCCHSFDFISSPTNVSSQQDFGLLCSLLATVKQQVHMQEEVLLL